MIIETIAREGGIVYQRRGTEVYRALPGCLFKYYCLFRLWPRSHAARRIRGEFGGEGRRWARELEGVE